MAAALARAAATESDDVQPFARALLDEYLYRQPVRVLGQSLRDKDAEVRQSAARVFPTKQPKLVDNLTDDLIHLVADGAPSVREAARQALVKVSNGEDFGPAGKDAAALDDAEKKWREWWSAKKRETPR